jgi:hypothetical protein
MLQCDFCYMISPAMFERFVLPELVACCNKLDYSFYHLDGPGALNHLDLLLDIPKLHGIQWIPGAGKPSATNWPDLLDKIRAKGKLIQIVSSTDEALKCIRRTGGKGFQFWVSGVLTAAEAEKFLREAEKAWTGR